MDKRHLVGVAALLLAGGMATAQVHSASQPQKLVSAQVGLMAPVWSPDGSMIAVTSDNYKGIYVADADGSNLRILTNDDGAGYKMAWSADGRSLAGRANVVEGKKIQHQMRSYGLDGTTKAVGQLRRTTAQPGVQKVETIYGVMATDPAGATRRIPALAQFQGRTIINPALSPDGSQVAFQVPGKGMWLVSADGSDLRSLGKGSHPAWMPDSRTLLYTIVEDNGAEFTASTLMSLDVRTGFSATVVSASDMLPLTPAVAPDGCKVAFENALDASIYVVNLKK